MSTITCRYCRLDIRNDGGEWCLIWPSTDEEDVEADPFDCDSRAGGHAPKVERDEVLMAEVRDQCRDLGMCEYEVDDALGVMRDEGMFDVRDWA